MSLDSFVKNDEPEKEVEESTGKTVHRIGLTVTDPNHPMVSKRGETYQKSVRVTGEDREKAINSAIAHYRRKGFKVHDHHYLGTVEESVTEGIYQGQFKSKEEAIQGAKERVKTFRDPLDGIEIWAMPSGWFDQVNTMNSNGRNHCIANGGKKIGTVYKQGMEESITEAPGDFGLGANYRAVPDDEMQAFLDRSKTKNKTKRDKFDYPYVHGSNIQVKDESGKKYDLEALKKEIMTRPKSILGQNAKMQHSAAGDEVTYDIGLPALKGLAVNEKAGQFVIVDTCPGAGACQTYCYAMKGSYVMFKAVSMGLARMLNFLLNDPEGFTAKLNAEIATAKAKLDKKNIKLNIRWHNEGDFFSPEYLDMAYKVAEANPTVGFYAYTKMGDVANAARPKNFNMNFSQGAKRGQEKKVDIVRTKHSKVVPKDMFFDLIARKGNELIKDDKGRMQFASPANLDEFKTRMAQKYAIDKDSILTYDQMMKIPVGDTPKWNVIVMPGDGDNSANRNDVVGSYLLFH